MNLKSATSAKRSSNIQGVAGYLPSETRLQTLLWWGVVLVGPILLFLVYYKIMFPGLTNADALDFAQIGRNLSEGRGFSTSILRPLGWAGGANLPVPDATHSPLYPFLLALVFGVAGAKDSAAAFLSGLFYLLTIPLIYRFGYRVGGARVGLLASLGFVINALSLEYAVSGLHITLYVCLTTALFLKLHTLATPVLDGEVMINAGAQNRDLALAGLLCGALYLTDPIFIWLIPVVLLALLWLRPAPAGTIALWFGVPLLALTLPWMARNLMVSGNPIFGLRASELWMNTQAYPGSAAYRTLPSEFVPGVSLLRGVVGKVFVGTNQVIQAAPQVSAGWLLTFFLPGLLFRLPNNAANFTRAILLISFFAVMFGTVLFSVQMPLMVSMVPAMLVFSVAFMMGLLERGEVSQGSLRFLTAVFGFLLVFPLFSDMFLSERPTALRAASAARTLRTAAQRGDVAFSDQPWIVAWYAQMPAIWLPATDQRVSDLRNNVSGVRWLFLTDQSRSYSTGWQYVYDVLNRWNAVSRVAKQEKTPPPSRIVIAGQGMPVLEGLAGFTAWEPMEAGSRAVVAFLPPGTPKNATTNGGRQP